MWFSVAFRPMPDQNDFHGLWDEVAAEYEKQTGRELDKDSRFHDIRSLDDFEKLAESEGQNFAVFRKQNQALYSKMSACIKPILPMLDLISAGIGNTPYAPVRVVLGAGTYLLKACQSTSNAYDGIEELFERVGEVTARLNEYDFKSVESSLRAKVTTILAYILDIMGKAEGTIRRKRFRQWARSVFLQEDPISSALSKLEKYVSAELGLVIALTYGRVKTLQVDTAIVQADVRSVKSAVDEVLGNQRTDRLRSFNDADEKKINDALKTGSYDEIARQHASNVEKLTKGTGDWIRDDIMFKSWEQESAPLLWVFGRPGVGKTMLAARTIENLHSQFPQHSDIPSLTSVSYVYFKDGNPELRDCVQLWKAAALQIAKANDRFKKHVLALIEKKQDTFASARRIWQQLFLDFFTETSNPQALTSLAFIIIDGLDEAPEAERVKLLACLADLVNTTTANRKCRIQVAVFARPDIRADPGYEKIGVRRQERIIEVTPERNSVDIEAFIRQRLGDVKVLNILRKRKATKEYQTLAKQIYSSVLSRSQGMFLWASLVFDQIWNSPSSESITQSLGSAPEGLDAMLHHVFKRLEVEEEMHRSYLSELLTWVYCAYRPMYISELFVLLTITANQHCYMVEDDLRTRYASLFAVSGPLPDEDDSDVEEEEPADSDGDSGSDDFDFLNDTESSADEGTDEEESDDASGDEASSDVVETKVEKNTADDDTSFKIPTRWGRATVSFSHARIHDYLATEGNSATRRWHDCSIIPENMNVKHLSLFTACVALLRTDITAQYSNIKWLRSYAQVCWVKHLTEVDFTQLDDRMGIQIAQTVSTLFYNGQVFLSTSIKNIDGFLSTWFATNKFSVLVRRIIADHIAELDTSQQEWASSTKDSARNLFQPLIDACAHKWLVKKGWDDTAYLDKSENMVRIMYAFHNLVSQGINSDNVRLIELG